jgi:hypothetical protein
MVEIERPVIGEVVAPIGHVLRHIGLMAKMGRREREARLNCIGPPERHCPERVDELVRGRELFLVCE